MNVKEIIVKIAKQNHIKLDINNEQMTLKDVGIDSLAMMDLIFKIEAELDILIDDAELIKIKTLGDLIKTIEATLNHKK